MIPPPSSNLEELVPGPAGLGNPGPAASGQPGPPLQVSQLPRFSSAGTVQPSALRSAQKIADASGDSGYRLTQARAHAAHHTADRPGHPGRRLAQP